MGNPGLLKILPECEYPAEFLAARLLGKRGALFCKWEALIAGTDVIESLRSTPVYPFLKELGPSGIWVFLRDEHMWVYGRMNPGLRKRFAPYFIYQELRTLIVCLRYLSRKKETGPVRQALHNSLLHKDIQVILTAGQDLAAKLHTLESRLCGYSGLFQGLSTRFANKGITALEIFLWDRFFASVLEQKLPAGLQIFFQDLIDFHNCMALAKNIRWQIETAPELIPGGMLPPGRVARAFFRKDLTPLFGFLHLHDTAATLHDPRRVETALLSFITGRLKNSSLQRTVVGDILFYLWEVYRYTRNISMILKTMILADEPVRADIVA